MNRHASPDEKPGTPRYIFDPPPIRHDYDATLLGQEMRGTSLAVGFQGKYRQSHVLLAACGRDESAFEYQRIGGFFTWALMKSLTELDIRNLTYTSLMHGLAPSEWYRRKVVCSPETETDFTLQANSSLRRSLCQQKTLQQGGVGRRWIFYLRLSRPRDREIPASGRSSPGHITSFHVWGSRVKLDRRPSAFQ